MRKSKTIQLGDSIFSLWTLILRYNGGIKISDVYKNLENKYTKDEIDGALTYLNDLYLIDYKSIDGAIVLKKKEILGEPFEDIPCIGCEHLHECHIGGERFSPENCEYFNKWINKFLKY